MAKTLKGPRVLTGNLLTNGQVVFLGADGFWRNDINTAHVVGDDAEIARLETRGAEAAAANLLVEPYFIEVQTTDLGLTPVAFRERRRIAGPSVNLEFNNRVNGKALVAA